VSTKVDEVAALARVSPATVFAVTGGKHGLLHTLIDDWTRAPEIGEVNKTIAELTDPHAILDMDASLTRRMHENWGDIMRLLLATAPLDEIVAVNLKDATKRYRAGLKVSASRLAKLDALKPGLTVKDTTDVLWFYFGYQAYGTLKADNGWSADRTEHWLRASAATSLLKGD
jgi:AcrR family transcriptional regulator